MRWTECLNTAANLKVIPKLLYWQFIMVVKKTFHYTNVILLQTLMPPFLISEHKYEKRYNCLLERMTRIPVLDR